MSALISPQCTCGITLFHAVIMTQCIVPLQQNLTNFLLLSAIDILRSTNPYIKL